MIKPKSRRCKPGVSRLAVDLGKGVSTIRRWIRERPELHAVLRVRRHGKQLRISYPANQLEFENWLEQIRQAVSSFSRSPIRTNDWVRGLWKDLGFGDQELERKQRDRDIKTLRHAMRLKRASLQVKDEEGEETHLPQTDLGEWNQQIRNCCFVANWIAGRLRCPVWEAPKYWADFCRKERDKNHQFKSTDEDIAAEVMLVEQLWPTTNQWKRAHEHLERHWQVKTLAEAAWELMREDKPISGISLAPLVFRNQRTEDIWLSHQRHLELKANGNDVFCDEGTVCRGAKRGISLREFRQRYTKRDVITAIKQANAAYGHEPSLPFD